MRLYSKIFFISIFFSSCTRGEKDFITIDVNYNTNDSVISITYTNNTNNNYFFISPKFSICKEKINNKKLFSTNGIVPCINNKSYVVDSSLNYYNDLLHVIKKNELKYFNEDVVKEKFKNFHKNSAIIILPKNLKTIQKIKVNAFEEKGNYEFNFLKITEHLKELKISSDPNYSFFKSYDSIYYEDFLYHNKDFNVINNKIKIL